MSITCRIGPAGDGPDGLFWRQELGEIGFCPSVPLSWWFLGKLCFAVPPSGEDVWDFAGFARDLSSCAGRKCFPLQPECKDPRAKLSAVISWWGLGR